MKILVPPEKHKLFDRYPSGNRPLLSEIAAGEFFKLLGWATATAGIYLLTDRTGLVWLSVLPYFLCLFIVWHIAAKVGWLPELEKESGNLYLLLPKRYWFRLVFVAILSASVSLTLVFWLAPLIYRYGLANL